ncbi:NitT/TauT family transport system permease protein [Spinactinospora alkalitolerans]|uniref:NitT/TauT family transport system permease protein n=1 Tax=Spinactinospora alkalitolerans TaxID=687207 RepID=A0A852TSY6_9ACTN|nr:ABC transporter permease subunit [Spinactinospora alkalitolerans]NYE47129.1 NitT/TauT family transport system permease protein [Spinactinospora alkalitolerans]
MPVRQWATPFVSALGWFFGVAVVGTALWEGYKAFGQLTGDVFPGTDINLPVSTDDLAMPHTWSIAASLIEPVQRGVDISLGSYLVQQAMVTLQESFAGLLLGTLVGVLLAVVFLWFGAVRQGLMPWVVASQTVPLVAIAPMVVVWGGQLGLPAGITVAAISAYLAFFPIVINMLRGLQSPPTIQVDLMRSIAASNGQSLRMLRFPAALPYLFAGLRVAATASVIGAIVGELSAGTGNGIGRVILNFTYYYSSGPEKLYAAVLVASLAGIVFVQFIHLAEGLLLRRRPRS